MRRTLLTAAPPSETRILRAAKNARLDKSNAEKLAELAREQDQPLPSVSQTAAGDSRKLRGIPVMAPGVGSTIAGTDPLAALLAKERNAERSGA